MARTVPALLTLAVAATGCVAGRPTTSAPALTAATAKNGEVPNVDHVMVVPRPARSIARLRALLRGTPAASAPVERALAAFQSFDLEEPILLVQRDGTSVTSFGISRETAARLRASGADKCDAVDVRGKPRIACQIGVEAMDDEGRTLATVAPPSSRSDVHLETSAAGLARDLAKDHDIAALAPFLAPLGGFTFDVSLEGTPEVRLAFALDGTKDGVTRSILEAPVAPPPATFFRLPGDAEIAAFAHAPAAAEMAQARELVAAALVAGPECSADEQKAARAELDKLIFTGGTLAVAAGFDRARSEAAAESGDAKKLTDAERGWAVLGFDEPAERWAKGVSWLAMHGCGKGKPNATTKKPAGALALPAGTVEIVDRGTKSDRPTYTFVVPDGAARTWVAFGGDEALVAQHVRTSVRGTEGTLASRAGLGSLRGPATFGGFVTASAVRWLAHPGDVARVRTTRALPTGGRTPLPFRGSVVKEGSGGTIATRVTVEPAALGDLVALFAPAGEAD